MGTSVLGRDRTYVGGGGKDGGRGRKVSTGVVERLGPGDQSGPVVETDSGREVLEERSYRV